MPWRFCIRVPNDKSRLFCFHLPVYPQFRVAARQSACRTQILMIERTIKCKPNLWAVS